MDDHFHDEKELEHSFSNVLEELKNLSGKRDPRSVRLAAVTCAVVDVASSATPDKPSPASVYASTVSALEGTLSSDEPDFSTQVALLELLCATVPHVAKNTLQATFAVTSRVVRALVASTQAVSSTQETNDELGGLNATLRATCRASTQIMKCVSPQTDETAVQQFIQATLLTLFQDKRPKVRKAAHQGALELLRASKPNATFMKTILAYTLSTFARAKKQVQKSSKTHNQHGHHNSDLLHLCAFMEQGIVHINTPKIRDTIMELLMVLLQQQTPQDNTSSDFVAAAPPKRDMTSKIVTINGLLSVLLVVLDQHHSDEDEMGNNNDEVDGFAARVVASLVQCRPTTVFASADEAVCGSGKILYGRAMLVACQRLLVSSQSQHNQVGHKLLPLGVQVILQLARPESAMETDVSSIAQDLMVELTQTFRSMRKQKQDGQHQQQCWLSCMNVMKQHLLEQQQLVFRSTWSCTLAPLALLVDFLVGPYEGSCKSVVTDLVNLHNSVKDNEQSKQAIEECLGSIIQSVGIETFWNWIDWNNSGTPAKFTSKNQKATPTAGGIPLERSWLLPLLKTSSSNSASHPSLEFFQQKVLSLARECDMQGATGKKQEKQFQKARVVDLWNLFPCCCQNPPDISDSFAPLAQKTLVKAVGDTRYPQLVTIICSGLKVIAAGVLERIHGDDSEFAQGDAQILAQTSTKLLPALFKLVETLQGTGTKSTEATGSDEMETEEKDEKNKMSQDAQKVQCVTDAIAELCRLAPKPFLQALFKKIMHRLLASTQSQSDESEKICTLLGLAQALVASEALDEESISLLYRSLKPLIRTDEFEARVQKRAYKVMAEICQRYHSFATASDRLEEITDLLVGSIMTCQVSARHMRLKCMTVIVKGFSNSNKQQMDVIPKVVPEVLLCLKDSNGKTREAAYQLLLSMASVRSNMLEYFRIVLAALGAQTPHMRSAAVMALSRLVFEYARDDVEVQTLLPSLLETVIVLFDENAREVIKSVVGFVRVSVAAMTAEQLEPLLPDLVKGMLKFHRGKDRFRAKIKIILKKLVRNYGYDALMPLVPEGDTRLLTHMRKLDERAKRRKAAQRPDGQAANNDFDDMMESDEEDSDDGRTLMTGMTGFTKMTGRSGKSQRTAAIEKYEKARSIAASTKASGRSQHTAAMGAAPSGPRIRAETGVEVHDMLDPKMAKSVRFADNNDGDSDMEDGGAMEFDDMGRLVVPDDLDINSDGEHHDNLDDDANDNPENDEIKVGGKKRRISKFESAKVTRDESKKKKNKQKTKDLGAAYKSKKAGGDVKKKGQKYEPYAYVPLDGRSYTKKNRRQAVEQMSSVVRGGKRKRN
mmetsp:Transcript_6037/g.8557  ORF Transcript_6037/g.8557 Transcript_6037/m.8557 type:complete len:1336 (-) Transcript_6037:89-4096(-)